MRAGILAAGLIALGTVAAPARQQPPEILRVLQGIDPGIQFARTEGRLAASDGSSLILVHGSRWEGATALFAILARDRAGNTRSIGHFTEWADDIGGCCVVRIISAAPGEIVLAQGGEKSPNVPNVKFFLDVASRSSTSVKYGPFVVQESRDVAGIPHFIATDGKELVIVRASTRSPFLDLLPQRDVAEVASRLNVTPQAFNTTSGRHGYPDREGQFGPGNSFIIDNGDSIKERTANGPREYPFPKSTFEELIAANPDLRGNVTRNNIATEEAVGPWQIVGSRLWFGREFYAGEGFVGVGAFGNFDASTRAFKLFTLPELRRASVFALRIEANVAWLGLGGKGEWGDGNLGLLRVDLQTMRTRTYDLPGMATAITRLGEQLYVSTSEGISVLHPGGQIDSYFIDIARNGEYQLSLARSLR